MRARQKIRYLDTLWNHKNRIIMIVSAYVFSGINFICSACLLDEKSSKVMIALISVGILLLLMGLVSIFDNRKEMRSKFAVNSVCVMHFAICLFFSFSFSFWWLLAYVGEVLICAFVVKIVK